MKPSCPAKNAKQENDPDIEEQHTNNASAPFVDAVYRKELDPDLKGNPFVEALPALLSLKQYQEKLLRRLQVTPEERAMNDVQRLVRLGTLSQVCIPLPRVVNLAQSIHMMLFDGYRTRAPFSAGDQENVQRLYAAQQSGTLTTPGDYHHASQFSMSLVGVPGAGKTFILKKIASMFPPVIFHKEIGRWQVPFLFIEMPYEGESRLALASHIFTELDRLLPDSNYRRFIETKRPNAEQLCIQALMAAYEMGVGMIVVDEAQNSRVIGNDLVKARRTSSAAEFKRRETGLKKLLITASNVGHMPLLFTGTMELESTLAERATLGRRKSGHGSATWQPLSPVSSSAATPSEFDIFMSILFSMQWLPEPVAYKAATGTNWSQLFFKHTEGIPDLMVKLFQSTQVAAIRAEAKSMNESHVVEALEEFRSAAPIVEGLAKRDEASLTALTDLFGLAPIELKKPALPPPTPLSPRASRQKNAEDLAGIIEKRIREKNNKTLAREAPGASPLPVHIPLEALAEINQVDLRKRAPVVSSPLGRSAG